MNEISKEVIEIDGKEYTLFLNRAGIVSWELYSKKEKNELIKVYDEISPFIDEANKDEISAEIDPLELGEKIDFVSSFEESSKLYKKLYWIMLSKFHKMSLEEVSDLFDKAVEEYGLTQLVLLGNQMIHDLNVEKYKKRKNLPALRQVQK